MSKPKRNDKQSNGSTVNRRDQCQTPDYALDPILPYLKPEWVIWEPARGGGYIERTLLTNGHKVISGDLLTGQNYFLSESVPDHYDVMVTNPPFSIKYKWLTRAYLLDKPFALIMPLDVLGSGQAQALFDRYGFEFVFMNKRIDYGMPNIGFEGSSSQFASVWFTWRLGIGRPFTFAKISKRKQMPMESIPEALDMVKQMQLFDIG